MMLQKEVRSSKSGKSRTVTVVPYRVTVLPEQRPLQNRQRMAADVLWKNEFHLVFINELSRPLNRKNLYNYLKKTLASIGMNDCYFHTLHYTFATLFLQNADGILTLKENLWHHSAAFTQHTYSHLTQALRRNGAEHMEKLIQATVISKNALLLSEFSSKEAITLICFCFLSNNSKNRTLSFDKVRQSGRAKNLKNQIKELMYYFRVIFSHFG